MSIERKYRKQLIKIVEEKAYAAEPADFVFEYVLLQDENGIFKNYIKSFSLSEKEIIASKQKTRNYGCIFNQNIYELSAKIGDKRFFGQIGDNGYAGDRPAYDIFSILEIVFRKRFKKLYKETINNSKKSAMDKFYGIYK